MARLNGVVSKIDGKYIHIECESGKSYLADKNYMDELPQIGTEVSFSLGIFNVHGTKRELAKHVQCIKNSLDQKPFSGLNKGLFLKAQDLPKKEEKIKEYQGTKQNEKESKGSPVLNFENQAQHFYLVFNPLMNDSNDFSRKTQAHDIYDLVKKHHDKGGAYWGKLKVSVNEDLNLNNFTNVFEQNNKLGQSTHLYISDFHNFWVARVVEIINGNTKIDMGRTVAFYKTHLQKVEVWFRIDDMDLLSSDSAGTIKCISNLYHTDELKLKGKGKGITPYMSNLRYPLIVEDHEAIDHFAGEKKRVLVENDLIDKPENYKNASERISSYCIPYEVFTHICESVRQEIIHAESLMLGRKNYDEHKIARDVALIYLRALEVSLNQLFIKKLKNKVGEQIKVNSKGQIGTSDATIPLANFTGSVSLGSFSYIIDFIRKNSNKSYLSMFNLFQGNLDFWKYLNENLAAKLPDYANIRNDLAHDECPLSVTDLHLIRREILGVGCEGIFNELYKSFYKEQIKEKLEDVA